MRLNRCLRRAGLVVLVQLWVGLPAAALQIFDIQPRDRFDRCARELIALGLADELVGAACADALVPEELSDCAATLSREAGIAPTTAVNSCYQVRRPVDLSECVVAIDNRLIAGESDDAEAIEVIDGEAAPTAAATAEPGILEDEDGDSDVLGDDMTAVSEADSGEATTVVAVEPDVAYASTDVAADRALALSSCQRSLLPLRFSDCVVGIVEETSLPLSVAAEECLTTTPFLVEVAPGAAPDAE